MKIRIAIVIVVLTNLADKQKIVYRESDPPPDMANERSY